MSLFWLKSDLATDQRMVRVAVCTLVRACDEHISEVTTSGDDQVELVPVFVAGVSPGHLMLGFRLEE